MKVQEVFEFMNSGRLAVLATVSENLRPEAALMGFCLLYTSDAADE